MSTLLTSGGALFQIWDIQRYIFSKEVLSMMEQVRIMPAAPLQQVCVIFLKRSCPAVSHICSLYLLLPILIVLILKSTPMVATQFYLKLFSQKRVIRLVLPTPLSPIIITFAMKSYFYVFLADSINTLTIIIYYNKQEGRHFLLILEHLSFCQTKAADNCNDYLQLSKCKLKYIMFYSLNIMGWTITVYMKQLINQQ